MPNATDCEPAAKCTKCHKATATTDAIDATNFTDCICQAKTEQAPQVEALDPDLTTTETLDDLDELDEKPATKIQPKPNPNHNEEQQQQPPPPPPPPQPEEVVKVQVKASNSCPQRGGKVTRSSLNGARSPTIMKRLRKSTRSTRFKSKLTGRGNASAGGALNGHNGQAGAGGPGQTTSPAAHTAGAGALSKSHGKSGGGGGGGAGGGSGARNRRTLFKRPAQKTPRVQACTQFVKSIFYKGSYMQIGDIVSIVDSEQNVFYAQIRGLLVDAYCEKSAFLTWLIPTQDSPDPHEGFDPATYLIGPDEELSRKLCYLEFVMHAPSNYYYDRSTPYPLPDVDEYTSHRTGGFIWTRLPTVKRDRERERERERKAAA